LFKSITLRNFQSHINTCVPLSPGITLITGTSDHGKSAIARGFKWAIINRPYKDVGLRNETVDDKTEFSVALELDDGTTVTRFKDNNTNGYRLSTQVEPIKVIKTDVPQEIQDVLKMTDINIQEQHNPYFLLNDKGSAVAAAFNEMVGLSVMDQCVEEARVEVNLAKAALKSTEVEVVRVHKELSKVVDTTDIEVILSQVHTLNAEYIATESKLSEFNYIIDAYQKYSAAINVYAPIVQQCEEEVVAIEKVFKRLELCTGKMHDMTGVIDTYTKTSTAIQKITIPTINTVLIEDLLTQVDNLDTTCVDMDVLITSYTTSKTKVADVHVEVDTTQIVLDDLLLQYTDCPLCGSVLHN